MSKQLRNLLIAVAVIAAIVAALVTLFTGQSAKAPGFPPAVVASAEVSAENWQPVLNAVGSLVATNGIQVSSETSGIVSAIVFKSGQAVEQGQLLIRLDDSVDEAALAALRAERRLAEIQFTRAQDLLKKRVMSKSEYDVTEANFEAATARVKQQEAIIRRKQIRAPFAGLAGIREVDLGQYLEAGNPIVSLQALDPMYVDYNLPERYSNQVKVGQVVNIRLDAVPGQVFRGEVSAIDAGINTGTRSLKVRATVANPGNVMRPGMFAEVETITGDAEPVLTVPHTAISFNTYGNFIFVINADANSVLTVKRTPIETGEVRAGRVAVKGLQPGTQVVRAGLVKLRDGAPVKIDNKVELNDKEIKGE